LVIEILYENMCLIKSGKKRKIKINVGEAITSGKAAFQMYYNLWNIHEVRGHYCSGFALDQGIFKKAKWQLGSKCPSSYSTLKTSIASRILTPTGAMRASVQVGT